MITTAPLSSETWNEFESLMQTDNQCNECWCLNHRKPAGCATGSTAKAEMLALTQRASVHGLLAYENQSCIGWIAIDPMSDLVGHDLQSTGKKDEWSIHCLFVKDGFRGKGISSLLIRAAIDYAQSKGAKLISAFPIPHENRNRFPPNEAEFSGRFSTFKKMGFNSVGEASEFYQRMELFYG